MHRIDSGLNVGLFSHLIEQRELEKHKHQYRLRCELKWLDPRRYARYVELDGHKLNQRNVIKLEPKF